MFKTITANIPADSDLPARARDIDILGRILNGTLYDCLPHQFHEETSGRGEYVPLRSRAPSVRYNLARLVVEDSVSLLFGEGRFPEVECDNKTARADLRALLKASHINAVMTDAAVRGSVGSVAVLMRVLRNRLFLDVLDTAFLTPAYDPEEPDLLISVTELRKVRGQVLADAGYDIKPDQRETTFWFQRVWDSNADTWSIPWPVAEQNATPQPDPVRSVVHSLGFVPIVWFRNLPGGMAPDGACTFRQAIDTSIEIDYQLSQAGRGLKYSSDPTLMIKEPATDSGQIVRSASNALIVSSDGDAKLLEISGTASAAVLDYVRMLRELALESVHGNRSNADKVSAAQSGRALEMHHQALIWLADNLRITYGEVGLISLCKMIVAASRKVPIKIDGRTLTLDDAGMSLRWPAWFAQTYSDGQTQAATLATLRQSGHISQETAVETIAANYDIEDVPTEIARIKQDEADTDARLAKQAAQTKATETAPG